MNNDRKSADSPMNSSLVTNINLPEFFSLELFSGFCFAVGFVFMGEREQYKQRFDFKPVQFCLVSGHSHLA